MSNSYNIMLLGDQAILTDEEITQLNHYLSKRHLQGVSKRHLQGRKLASRGPFGTSAQWSPEVATDSEEVRAEGVALKLAN